MSAPDAPRNLGIMVQANPLSIAFKEPTRAGARRLVKQSDAGWALQGKGYAGPLVIILAHPENITVTFNEGPGRGFGNGHRNMAGAM